MSRRRPPYVPRRFRTVEEVYDDQRSDAERAAAIYESVRLLEKDDQISAPLVAVMPALGIFAWWNGSCTYQIARRNEALFAALRERVVPILCVWEVHDSPARDEEVARRELEALARANPLEDFGWNDEAAYRWAHGIDSFGPVYIFPGGELVDPERGESE